MSKLGESTRRTRKGESCTMFQKRETRKKGMRTEWESGDIEALAERVANKVTEQLRKAIPSMGPTEDEMMTVEGVAEFVKVRRSRIYSWVNETKHGRNDFPFSKAGSSLRFSKLKVLEWMTKRAEKTGTEGDL